MSNNIQIDGVDYEVSSLPADVQHLIGIYTKWSKDVEDAKLALAKNEAAVREVSREILEAVKDLAPQESVEVE